MKQKSEKLKFKEKIEKFQTIYDHIAIRRGIPKFTPGEETLTKVEGVGVLNKDEISILQDICFYTPHIQFKSDDPKIEEQGYQTFSAILDAKDTHAFDQAKAQLDTLKTQSQQAKPYNMLHYSGFGIGAFGVLNIVGIALILGLAISLWPFIPILGVAAIAFFIIAGWCLHTGKKINDNSQKKNWETFSGEYIKNFTDLIYTPNNTAAQDLLIEINSTQWQTLFNERKILWEENQKKVDSYRKNPHNPVFTSTPTINKTTTPGISPNFN